MPFRPDDITCPVPELDPERELRLLHEPRPWSQVFFENLTDTLLRRRSPRYWSRYPAADFWPDVFVPHGITWLRMRQSFLAHLLFVLAIYGLTDAWMKYWQTHLPKIALHKVVIYDLSEYLPPIDTGSPPAPKPRKGQPLLAKQKIVSLQPNADNREQTIITPPNVKLPTNIPLPNIVAWTNVPAPPTSLATRQQITMPNLPATVLAPAPDPLQRDLSKANLPNANVMAPAPEAHFDSARKLDVKASVIEPPPAADLSKLNPRAMTAPAPSVIAPPPDANSVQRNIGQMNIGNLTSTVAAPKIEVAAQRPIQLAPSNGGSGSHGQPASGSNSGGAAPPINPVGGMNVGPNAGQIIALNLHPAIPNGPIAVPPGRRSGEFAAGPEGTPGAPGTPDIKAGANGPGGSGTGTAGAGKGADSKLPGGITIGNAPGAPPPGSVVVAGTPAQKTPQLTDAARQVLMAAAHQPRVGDLTRPSSNIPDIPKVEDKVFGEKRIYTLALNMPNLTSSGGGSWIIRFAQLDDDHLAGAVSAPIALSKVDPAYPAELIRNGVEGTVILYAIIHKDGTVGDVRILRGIQGKLDENARVALGRWKFRPGTKNGQAVDLEAVVQIPFKVARLGF